MSRKDPKIGKRLGKNIKEIREAWGMSQPKFGDMFGVSKNMLSTWENGGHSPSIKFMVLLIETTGIPFLDLCKRAIDESEIPDKPDAEAVLQKSRINEMNTNTVELQKEMMALMKENFDLKLELEKLKK